MKLYSILTILACLAVSSSSASVADVLADISSISNQVTALDAAITNFPGTGGLIAALAIHTDAVNLGSSVNQGTTDINGVVPIPVSEADGQSILAAIENLVPTILDALQQVVNKKPAFDGVAIGGIGALVKQDLINLNAASLAFEAGLIAASPVDLAGIAAQIKAIVDAGFSTAIAANREALREDELAQKSAELIWDATLSTGRKDPKPHIDFFLMYLLTSSLFVRPFSVLKRLEHKADLLRAYLLGPRPPVTTLLMLMRGRPRIGAELVMSFD